MKEKSLRLLNKTINELGCAKDHLNTAFMHSDHDLNKEEIQEALKSVESALESAQSTLTNIN